MRDLEHARLMLQMARKDLHAIQGMEDPEKFANEIFGFHAQQAIEKALKAWLSFIGIEYPRSHDLDELFALLTAHGESVPDSLSRLAELTDFAVQYRYEAYDLSTTDLNREETCRDVSQLIDHVEKLIQANLPNP